MGSNSPSVTQLPGIFNKILPSVGPVLLISVAYVDPGKWAATIESGARFGVNLLVPMLVFNFIAIFCQYLSARISLFTGKDLAQICCDEYDKWTCMLLGVQAMISVIMLDLTTILGIAHGLNMFFGVDLSTCIFLTAVDAFVFPLFSLLEKYRTNAFCSLIAGSLLLLCFYGVLMSQPDVQLSMNGVLSRLNEESAYALMSLLGSSIVPHNLYLHSSMVLQQPMAQRSSELVLWQHHLFAIFCVLGGICIANCVLMNYASNVFYNTGLVLLTYPDAMSLLEQVLRGPFASFSLMLILYTSNQITALTWDRHGRVVMHDFLGLDIPSWLQRATIRIIAIVPALFCVWTSGVEGLYQLLVFTQVIIAALLPSSLIPLFRVASSKILMGSSKISQLLEFLAIVAFVGLLGLKMIFVVETIFGDCDWIGNLRWNVGSSSRVPYVVLLVTACSSLCFMLWLAATPLKSATRLHGQVWNWDVQSTDLNSPILKPFEHSDEKLLSELPYRQDGATLATNQKSDLAVSDPKLELPETIIDPHEQYLSSIADDQYDLKFKSLPKGYQEESRSICNPALRLPSVEEIINDVPEAKPLRIAPVNRAAKVALASVELPTSKEENRVLWEAEEISRSVPDSTTVSYDGPPSFSSLSGKSEEGGNSAGSLSRLALGRAARRQLAVILDEFWGHFFDLHGQSNSDAKASKIDETDSRCLSAVPSAESNRKQLSGYFPSQSSNSHSPKSEMLHQSIDSLISAQKGSYWSNNVQMLDAYVQGSNHTMDSAEKWYSNVRSSSIGWENQPATVHGYQLASLANRIAREIDSDNMNGQRNLHYSLNSRLGQRSYGDQSYILGQPLRSDLNFAQGWTNPNLAVSRNMSLQQSERLPHDLYSLQSVDNGGILGSNNKKYHSLPDISGLSASLKNAYMSEHGQARENSVGCKSFMGNVSAEPSFYTPQGSVHMNSSYKQGYGENKLSYSLTSDPGSIWSKQPYEQFGVTDKSRAVGSRVGSNSNLLGMETASSDAEARHLQLFRNCIMKLLKLEGCDWLFGQNDGADEELIERVAAREKCLFEAETRETGYNIQSTELQYTYPDKRASGSLKNYEGVTAIPNCGEGCVWKVELIVSFGVWCIHRILDLSLIESRPELWGKYTYVLNRLQGIIDPAFSKPRAPKHACFCLHLSAAHHQFRSSPPSHGMLPPASKPGRGKCTTAAMLLDLIKDVETAVSCRKGRSGTAAGDVAYPKGKENLASVLKRYKRRLGNKPGVGK